MPRPSAPASRNARRAPEVRELWGASPRVSKGLSWRRHRRIVVKVLLGLLILSSNMAFSCEGVLVHEVENGGKSKAEEAARRLLSLERATKLAEKREDKEAIDKLLRDLREERTRAADEDSAKAYAAAEQEIADADLIATIETEDAPRDAEDLKESDDRDMCGTELDGLPKGVLCKYLETYEKESREPSDKELGEVFVHSAEHCLRRNYEPEQVQAVRQQLNQLRTYRHIAEATTTPKWPSAC